MKLKKILVGFVAVTFLACSGRALSVSVIEGAVSQLEPQQFLTNFGMLVGSIIFKLGDYTWPADEIWLVPVGTEPSQFKSSGTYLEIPENITYTTCKTSVYYNSTYGFAFKSLATILPNGTFCILAYNGTYDIIAKY
ncbi:MAG: hypothetical protein QW040_03685 [Candidatus Aenigmatarchaeota archaeon]